MTARDMQDKILVAVIVAPHGVGGAVSAEQYSDNPRRFDVGAALLTDKGGFLHIASASPHKGRLLLTFTEISDRTAAEALRGVKLYIDETDVAPLPEGCWYHYQLLGLTVQEGTNELGKITDVLSYSSNDVYIVKNNDGRELLIPAIKEVVLRVDLTHGVMEVRLPEGLL